MPSLNKKITELESQISYQIQKHKRLIDSLAAEASCFPNNTALPWSGLTASTEPTIGQMFKELLSYDTTIYILHTYISYNSANWILLQNISPTNEDGTKTVLPQTLITNSP